jgi:predicted O-methyltransferase YrrM
VDLEGVAVDVIRFCSIAQHQHTYCSDENIEIIAGHATQVLKSKELLSSLKLQDLCMRTMVGSDPVVVAQMAKELVSMASNANSKTKYVEIGSYLGCSTFLVANLTAGSGAMLYAHDLWVEKMELLPEGSNPPPQTEDYFLRFYAGVIDRGFEQSVIPIRGPSSYTLAIHPPNSISLAFVDGDHSYDGCIADLRALWPRMRSGGLVYIHDVLSKADDDVTLCLQAFTNEIGSGAQVEMVGQTTFARISVP